MVELPKLTALAGEGHVQFGPAALGGKRALGHGLKFDTGQPSGRRRPLAGSEVALAGGGVHKRAGGPGVLPPLVRGDHGAFAVDHRHLCGRGLQYHPVQLGLGSQLLFCARPVGHVAQVGNYPAHRRIFKGVRCHGFDEDLFALLRASPGLEPDRPAPVCFEA